MSMHQHPIYRSMSMTSLYQTYINTVGLQQREMFEQVDQAPFSNKGRREPLGLRLTGLIQWQTLGVWLRKQLSWRLTEVVDDRFDLSSLLLVFDCFKVDVVFVRVKVEDVACFLGLR